MNGKPDAAFDERRTSAWIGKALLVQGRIVSTQDLTIDGTVEGTIELGDCSLTIGAGARVIADLAARTVVIGGTVTGDVTGHRVELRSTGAVEGDIRAPQLVMDDGAVLRGRVDAAGRRHSPPGR